MDSVKYLVVVLSVVVVSVMNLFSEEMCKDRYELDLSSVSDEVEYEVYDASVVIRGVWGVGPGEFGLAMIDDHEYMPKSFAVDSKGNIYILDVVNNRIQKFNKDGRYLLSIPVDSFRGKVRYWKGKPVENPFLGEGHYSVEPTDALGINIVIDSKDNLYYYCVKGNKGKVWMFKNDKLVKKWDVPVVDMEIGLLG